MTDDQRKVFEGLATAMLYSQDKTPPNGWGETEYSARLEAVRWAAYDCGYNFAANKALAAFCIDATRVEVIAAHIVAFSRFCAQLPDGVDGGAWLSHPWPNFEDEDNCINLEAK